MSRSALEEEEEEEEEENLEPCLEHRGRLFANIRLCILNVALLRLDATDATWNMYTVLAY
jgi:hypothetical protein